MICLPNLSRFILCLAFAGALTLLGCGGPAPANQAAGGASQPTEDRTTIDIKGFYADMNNGGVRVQRVNAEQAVYHIDENRFELTNVKVQFFDSEGLQVIEELYCNRGTWYTQATAEPRRQKNDMDLIGDVQYRSVDGSKVMMSDKIYYDDAAKQFISDDESLQVRVTSTVEKDENGAPILDENGEVVMTKALFYVTTAKGFKTNVGFTEWDYTNRDVNMQNVPYTQEAYDALVDAPPANAPDISDYEAFQ